MLGFANWPPPNRLAVADLPRYGATTAVYAMRSACTGELLYIGSTNNLRRRIFGNYLGGVGGKTTKRIHELLFTGGTISEVEVAWAETKAYREAEAKLKAEFRKEHRHLPEWNKQ